MLPKDKITPKRFLGNTFDRHIVKSSKYIYDLSQMLNCEKYDGVCFLGSNLCNINKLQGGIHQTRITSRVDYLERTNTLTKEISKQREGRDSGNDIFISIF